MPEPFCHAPATLNEMTDVMMMPLNQSNAVVASKTDASGNLVLSLHEIGLNSTVRYTRINDIPKMSIIDVVKSLTKKEGRQASKYFITHSKMCHTIYESSSLTFITKRCVIRFMSHPKRMKQVTPLNV